MVSFNSAKEMCNWSEDVCGVLAMCEGFMGMCNGTYVWVHVIHLPVYAWVCCSYHRGMYGAAVSTIDVGPLTRWSPLFFGLQSFSLWRLVCEGTVCM